MQNENIFFTTDKYNNLTDEEKVLLQRNVDFYISEQQKNSTNTIESSAGRDR